MNTVTSQALSTPPTPWRLTYCAAFVKGQGCHGTDTEHLVLLTEPRTRAELEHAWADLRKSIQVARAQWSKTHSTPPRRQAHSAPWTHATWGEERRAREASENERAAYDQGLKAAAEEARVSWWKGSGAVSVKPVLTGEWGSLVPISGLDYDDESTTGALAVLHEVGCMCGWGSTGYADVAKESDTAPPTAILTIGGTSWLAFANHDGTWPEFVISPKALDKLFEDAEKVKQDHLAEFQAEQDERTWAESLSPEEVDALDEPTYKRYAALTSKIARWANTQNKDTKKLWRDAVDAAEKSSKHWLLDKGLIEVTFDTEPMPLHTEVSL